MFVLSNFLVAFAQVVDYILWAYVWILIARVVISWVNADPYNPLVRLFTMLPNRCLVVSVKGSRSMPAASISLPLSYGSRLFFCNVFW